MTWHISEIFPGLPTSPGIKSKLLMIACKSLHAPLRLLPQTPSPHTLSSLTTGRSLASCQFLLSSSRLLECSCLSGILPPFPVPCMSASFSSLESQFISLSEQILSDHPLAFSLLCLPASNFYFPPYNVAHNGINSLPPEHLTSRL